MLHQDDIVEIAAFLSNTFAYSVEKVFLNSQNKYWQKSCEQF